MSFVYSCEFVLYTCFYIEASGRNHMAKTRGKRETIERNENQTFSAQSFPLVIIQAAWAEKVACRDTGFPNGGDQELKYVNLRNRTNAIERPCKSGHRQDLLVSLVIISIIFPSRLEIQLLPMGNIPPVSLQPSQLSKGEGFCHIYKGKKTYLVSVV